MGEGQGQKSPEDVCPMDSVKNNNPPYNQLIVGMFFSLCIKGKRGVAPSGVRGGDEAAPCWRADIIASRSGATRRDRPCEETVCL